MPAITDLLAGQTSLLFATMATALPHARAGKLRALATIGSVRSAAAAASHHRRVNHETSRCVCRTRAHASRRTPEQFAAFVKSEIAKWAPVAKASGARVD